MFTVSTNSLKTVCKHLIIKKGENIYLKYNSVINDKSIKYIIHIMEIMIIISVLLGFYRN